MSKPIVDRRTKPCKYPSEQDPWTDDEVEAEVEENVRMTVSHTLPTVPKANVSKEDLKKAEKKKDFLIKEFVQTEREYVDNLHNFKKYFIDKIKSFGEKRGVTIINPASLKVISSHFLIIIPVNEMFIKDIEEKQFNLSQFSSAVVTFSHAFKLYSDYIGNYESVLKTVETEKKKNSKFANYLVEVTKVLKKKEFRMVDIEDYLILPIQRIPRYKLLLQSLLKEISKVSSDTKELEKALELITKIADYCNQRGKELSMNRNNKMKELDELLNIHEFIQPHRHLIQEESNLCVKIQHKHKTKKEKCNIYLFSDILAVLVIHQVKIPKKETKYQTIAMRLSETLKVSQYFKKKSKLPKIFQKKPAKNRMIILSEERDDFILWIDFESEEVCLKWVNVIRKRIKEVEGNINKLRMLRPKIVKKKKNFIRFCGISNNRRRS